MKLREFIEKQNWRFAVTYAKTNPHEYIVKGKINGTDEQFEDFVKIIRKYGFKMYFWKHPNMYLYLDGHFYWTMGNPIEETTIINRSVPEEYIVSVRHREEEDNATYL